MDTEQNLEPQTEEEVIETQETEPVEAPEQEPSQDGHEENASQDGNVEPVETPAYVPNFKFKAFGKDHEIDPDFRSLIKDEASEKKVREFFERATGMDEYKNRYSEINKNLEEFYVPLHQKAALIAQAAQAKDFDTVIKELRLSEKDVLSWVREKVKFHELPSDQKEAIIRQRQLEQQTASLQSRSEQIEERNRDFLVAQRSYELDNGLARADVKDASKEWDSIYGEGAFRKEVINTGNMAFMNEGRDLSVKDALDATVARMKPLLDRLKPASQVPVRTQTRAIPSPQGRTGSPAKKAITSLDQIKKLAASMD